MGTQRAALTLRLTKLRPLGPFKAELMQRWYNEGYFQATLLMKRTQFDTDFTPVGELVQRAGDQPVFLSPLVHNPTPPGLARLDTVVDRAIPERNQHSPYQPVPLRSLRSSTLDSYLQNGSNVSDSPSSSFGGRFASPDIGAQAPFDQQPESRMPFAAKTSAIGTPSRRATVDQAEPMLGNRGFNGIGRTPGVEGLGFGGK